METPSLLTFDTSRLLGLALVARKDLSGARYVPLGTAPAERGAASHTYVRQLHAIANGAICGLTVHAKTPFRPHVWQRMTGSDGA